MDPKLVPLIVIGIYLLLLLGLGFASNLFFRGTSKDYFIASRSIGPFMLLMSIFGTTMTAFAMVGSTGKAFTTGIGTYGLMASWSGLVHSAVFFLVGIKLWAIGKRHGYVTQIEYFRARFESPALGYLLFPLLIGFVVPYLLIGLLGAAASVRGLTLGAFPEVFAASNGAIPTWLTCLVISAVVLTYVFWGGVRGAVWANTFQTIVFMATGVIAFVMIAKAMGGMTAASAATLANAPELLAREGKVGHMEFLTYCLIPLSVGMFPHIFQHWLTARSAKAFRLTCIAHPIFIMILWVPCILMGIWAAGMSLQVPNPNAVLGKLVADLVHSPVLSGLVMAGVLAAIMSSLDSQFMCVGTMFTENIMVPLFGRQRFSDRQIIWLARMFIVLVVTVTYLLTLFPPRHIFDLGVWCFSGFASLFPLVFAAVYWRRATKAGAIGSVLVTAIVWTALFLRDQSLKASGSGAEALVFGMLPVVVIFGCSLVTLVVVSLLTQPPTKETIEKFFPAELKGLPNRYEQRCCNP